MLAGPYPAREQGRPGRPGRVLVTPVRLGDLAVMAGRLASIRPSARTRPSGGADDLEDCRKFICGRHLAIAEIDSKRRRRVGINYVLQFTDFTDRKV